MLDNPFLIRELRQLERRPRGVQNSLLICLGLMVLVLVGWLWLSIKYEAANFSSGGFWLLNTLHVVLCGIAAGYGGYRLFAAEHYRSTLESLQLLPLSPSRWLLQKLAFPALCVLVACCAGVPLYIMAAACTFTTPDRIPQLLQKPLLGSVGILLVALLCTPEYMQKQQQLLTAQRSGIKQMDAGHLGWGFLIFGACYALGMGVIFGEGLTSRERPFYATAAPEALLWALGLTTIAPSAFLTAKTVLQRNEATERLAHISRSLALLAMYLIFVGLLWQDLNFWFRLGALLFIPFAWIIGRQKPSERLEPPGSEAYVQWVTKYWDNPLLAHDLRVFGRHLTVRRYFLMTLSVALAATAALMAAIWYWGPASLKSGVLWGAAQGGFQILPSVWGRTKVLWHKEWTGQTLPQLLITPLSEREIILGRLAAVPLFHWVGLSPVLGLLAGGLAWAIMDGKWFIAAVALSISPLFLTIGVWMSSNLTQRRPFSFKALAGDLRTFLLRAAQLVVLLGCFAVLIVGMLSLRGSTAAKGASFSWLPTPAQVWLLSLLLFACNTALCWGWIQLRIRQLRDFRTGDIEVPDSNIMNRASRKKAAKDS